jgi:chitin synthase
VQQITIEGIPHNDTYEDSEAVLSPKDSSHIFDSDDAHAIFPQAHHDAYFNRAYRPTVISYPSGQTEARYPGFQYNWQDDEIKRPILEHNEVHSLGPSKAPTIKTESYDPNFSHQSTASARGRSGKKHQEVHLFEGNLVLDCPVPPRLLDQMQHAQLPEREFTHMRYSAVTCDPSEFYDERFTLRQRLFAKPRHTELFIVVTMYNEEDELFARTMSGVIKNIEYMNSRTKSSTWGGEAWKKIVVCVVSDGRAKINPRTRAVLAGMGVYQDGIAKQRVNGKNVTAHVYEVSQHGKSIICSATCLPSAVSTPRT